MQLTVAELATILQVPNISETLINGVAIDSRLVKPGDLFIALPGVHTDGHNYVEDACNKGAVAALVKRHVHSAIEQILVPDCAKALGHIAKAWRQRFPIPLIAVTGSNGKTTVKNMIHRILIAACDGQQEKVLATKGNLNSTLGLPLTLCGLCEQQQLGVVEMGMNHFGEIDYMTHMAEPAVAVITNAAPCHTEALGGEVSGVAKAKGEIIAGVPDSGTIVLNADDEFYHYWRGLCGQHQVLSFTRHGGADVMASGVRLNQGIEFKLHTPAGNADVKLNLLGNHNITNVLAAAAATMSLGISLEAIVQGLAAVKPEPGRLYPYQLPSRKITVIDDAYNGNPGSAKAAITTLVQLPGRPVLVLADMKELGAKAIDWHREIGHFAKSSGVAKLFTLGPLAQHSAQAFGYGALAFDNETDLQSALLEVMADGDVVLFKGSASMNLQTVAQDLCAQAQRSEDKITDHQ